MDLVTLNKLRSIAETDLAHFLKINAPATTAHPAVLDSFNRFRQKVQQRVHVIQKVIDEKKIVA